MEHVYGATCGTPTGATRTLATTACCRAQNEARDIYQFSPVSHSVSITNSCSVSGRRKDMSHHMERGGRGWSARISPDGVGTTVQIRLSPGPKLRCHLSPVGTISNEMYGEGYSGSGWRNAILIPLSLLNPSTAHIFDAYLLT